MLADLYRDLGGLFNALAEADPISQWGWPFGLCVVLIGAYSAVRGWISRKQTNAAREVEAAKQDLDAERRALREAETELARLKRTCPIESAARLDTAARDNNLKQLRDTARDYLAAHRETFGQACRIRADDYLSKWEDGLDALRQAYWHALAARACFPDDPEMPRLLSEIDAARNLELGTADDDTARRRRQEMTQLRAALKQAEGDTDLLFRIGRAVDAAGLYRISKVIWARGERLAATQEGRDSATHLSFQFYIAQNLLHLGHSAEAERQLLALVPKQALVKGAKHGDTLSTRHEHARALLLLGRTAEAEAAFHELVSLRRDVQGAEHSGTLSSRHEHSRALLNLGRSAEAEAAFRELLPHQEKVHGIDHPCTLVTRGEHACALLNLGRTAEAEAAFRDLVTMYKKIQGTEHPHTLTVRHEHTRALLNLGRTGEAMAAFRDILPLEEKVQGADHPHTLATRRAMARAALEGGDWDLARDALAPLPADGGDPDPRRQGQTALLRAWLADIDGDAAAADQWLDQAETLLADRDPDHYVRLELARYRETRVPGSSGGTTLADTISNPQISD